MEEYKLYIKNEVVPIIVVIGTTVAIINLIRNIYISRRLRRSKRRLIRQMLDQFISDRSKYIHLSTESPTENFHGYLFKLYDLYHTSESLNDDTILYQRTKKLFENRIVIDYMSWSNVYFKNPQSQVDPEPYDGFNNTIKEREAKISRYVFEKEPVIKQLIERFHARLK